MPDAFSQITLAGDFFAGGADVAATNIGLTLFLAFLLLAGGALFNEALEENMQGRGLVRRMPGPVSRLGNAWRATWGPVAATWAAMIPGRTWLDRALAPAALLAFTGLIYTLIEPGVGFNERSLVLFTSLLVGKGVLTLLYEGGKARMYRQFLHVGAGLRLFPACLLIAAVSVSISRLGDLQPGFVVGFVAAVVLFERPPDDVARRGRAYAAVAATLLAASLFAWVLAIPLHELRVANPGFWTSLPESIALSVFVVCLEGLMFSLIPLKFMDGARIWEWNRVVWFALFLPTAFFFAQVLFNSSDAYFQMFSRSRSVATVTVLGGYLVLTFGTWAYFRWRAERREHPEPSGTPAG